MKKIGLIGLGAMGGNLARNIASRNISISVFNRTTETTKEYIKEYGNGYLSGEETLKDFVESLELPRKIILMVPAGEVVDQVINELKPLIQKGDIIIDCGNSFYKDTKRRVADLSKEGFHFFGCGVSGGEEGALKGPSLMPGGSKEIYEKIKDIFEPIAAKDFSGQPCITYIGDNGAGHFVKMVHNGIEYGVMQMIAEVYEIYRSVYKLSPEKISEIFDEYNKGKLNSYLIEITSEVLKRKDDLSDGFLIDKILDKAGQKGTGKWTSQDSLERDIALPSITESVFARVISSQKEKRVEISKQYQKNFNHAEISLENFKTQVENALYAAMLSNYSQGYDLIQKAAETEGWDINISEISRIWEGGCIIRAQILNFLHKAYMNADKNMHMLEIKEVVEGISENINDLRDVVSFAVKNGVPMPAMSTSLSYFEMMTSENLSANLIQGLRDYFGAHTYERIDKQGAFHTIWSNETYDNK